MGSVKKLADRKIVATEGNFEQTKFIVDRPFTEEEADSLENGQKFETCRSLGCEEKPIYATPTSKNTEILCEKHKTKDSYRK
jgi:hypothetical protein